MNAFFLGVVGGAVLLALCFSAVSLWFTLRSGSVSEVERKVSSIRLELTDVIDRVEQWQKRDRVRRVREGKEQAEQASSPAPAAAPVDRIARLRQLRAMGRTRMSAVGQNET